MKIKHYILPLFIALTCFSPKSFSVEISGEQKTIIERANQGNAKAQFNLGEMYENGEGVPQNSSKAKAYFKQACLNKSQPGCDAYKTLNQNH